VSRRRTAAQRAEPAEQLAQLLLRAYLAAYVETNPYHDTPATDGSEKVKGVSGWRLIAHKLLEMGVQLPEATK
jgi:hypothetical protein